MIYCPHCESSAERKGKKLRCRTCRRYFYESEGKIRDIKAHRGAAKSQAQMRLEARILRDKALPKRAPIVPQRQSVKRIEFVVLNDPSTCLLAESWRGVPIEARVE